MSPKLRLLKPQYKEHFPAEMLSSDGSAPELAGYLEDFTRDTDLQPLVNTTNHAINKYAGQQSKSDAWLAPRVHATLRLSRREAGDRRIWNYLAVGPLFKYVHWRWNQGEGGSAKFPTRFFGGMRDHAVARLWWGAELTRNGPSYDSTKLFFENTDVPNSWLNLHAFRHRPAAIASVLFIYQYRIDGVPVGDRHRDLVKGFNSALTTTVLDAVAANPPADPGATLEWLAEEIDETLYHEEDPTGPNEIPVPERKIEAVFDLLKRVAQHTNFKRRARYGNTSIDQSVNAR